MDYTEIRNQSILLGHLSFAKMGKEYEIYYDETNNSRLFKITDEGFNYDVKAYFILGGLIFEKGDLPSEESLSRLYDDLELQKNIKEIKFKHIKQGAVNFLDFLTKPRGQKLIDWLFKNDYWIHYAFRDNFYYSIVDIIDSMEESAFGGIDFNRELKNKLYTNIQADKQTFLKILRRFGYPNIVDQVDFIEAVIEWIEKMNQMDDFLLEYIRQSIKRHRKKSLVLLKNNREAVTIESYDDLYRQRILLFAYSEHTFDQEDVVEKRLKDPPMQISGQSINYKFVDSKDSQLVQLSDITVGILRMWLGYLEGKTIDELVKDFNNLNLKVKEVITQFQIILNKSLEENIAFKLGISSNDFEQKVAFFLNYNFSK